MVWSGNGSGTAGDPYQVATLAQLQEVGSYLSSYFILVADIDATDTENWNGGAGFVPIGDSTNKFTGSFDGRGYKITGLYINRPSELYVGLFGYSQNAVFRLITMVNPNITAQGRLGSILGTGYATTIERCLVINGSITGTEIRNTGGLAGSLINSSNISKCLSSASCNGIDNVGSMLGNMENSTMDLCIATGNIESSGNSVGGLIGRFESGCTINNCGAWGNVSGNQHVGGLVGYTISSFSKCYSTGSVSGTSNVGGLIGYKYSGSVNNSFWDTETSGQSSSAGGTGKTTAQMKTQATFTNWDFASIWFMSDTLTYPKLRSLQYPKKLVWHRKGG